MTPVAGYTGFLPPGINDVSEVRDSGYFFGFYWVVISPVGNLPNCNGYIYIPARHPRHSAAMTFSNYESFYDLGAPGGITYVRDGWIGFDTAHVGDCWPHMDFHSLLCKTCKPEVKAEARNFWDQGAVIEEIRNICQILALEKIDKSVV